MTLLKEGARDGAREGAREGVAHQHGFNKPSGAGAVAVAFAVAVAVAVAVRCTSFGEDVGGLERIHRASSSNSRVAECNACATCPALLRLVFGASRSTLVHCNERTWGWVKAFAAETLSPGFHAGDSARS